MPSPPEHTLVIRGGTVVDGSGREPFVADVAVDGPHITVVGAVSGLGETEIDARGLVVTPGFIDLHTHLDPYPFWQPGMAPAVFHGITTALMGNCSVSLAPCRNDPTHRRCVRACV
jgi:N-acyl-D-amino-acid deacylase